MILFGWWTIASDRLMSVTYTYKVDIGTVDAPSEMAN